MLYLYQLKKQIKNKKMKNDQSNTNEKGIAHGDIFETYIKDTFEDELADTVIRILDLCGARGIDIERHINLKLKYNRSRERMHGKAY